jgi:hypothetical protein
VEETMAIRKLLCLAVVVTLALGTCAMVAAQAQKAQKAEKAVKEAAEQTLKQKDVPAPVLAAFQKAYPKAKMIGFSKEVEGGQTRYEVESVEGKVHRDVTYAADGKVVSVEESLEAADIPPAVKAAIDKKFPGGKIVLAEKVTEGGKVGYEFQIEHNKKRHEIVFDAKGNEIKM